MQNIFIINAGCTHLGQGGTLNASYVKLATETLEGLGHRVCTTKVDEDYDLEVERDKVLGADVVILQTPGWWMSPPWQFKKYEDFVFHSDRLRSGDGRTRSDPQRPAAPVRHRRAVPGQALHDLLHVECPARGLRRS